MPTPGFEMLALMALVNAKADMVGTDRYGQIPRDRYVTSPHPPKKEGL